MVLARQLARRPPATLSVSVAPARRTRCRPVAAQGLGRSGSFRLNCLTQGVIRPSCCVRTALRNAEAIIHSNSRAEQMMGRTRKMRFVATSDATTLGAGPPVANWPCSGSSTKAVATKGISCSAIPTQTVQSETIARRPNQAGPYPDARIQRGRGVGRHPRPVKPSARNLQGLFLLGDPIQFRELIALRVPTMNANVWPGPPRFAQTRRSQRRAG